MTTNQSELDALLRQRLSSFVEKSFQTITPGDLYLPNWHVDCMAWHLEQCLDGKIKRLIITLPPRNLKSICASVAFPAWALGKDSTRKIICASYAQDLSQKLGRDCRAIMESDWYKKLFPATRIDPRKNTEQEFLTKKKGFRLSTSVGGTLTGRGGNLIIIDDPIKPSDAMSEAERERVKHWYSSTLYSRLDNKVEDTIILVMQRVHVDDLVGHVLENEDWIQVDIPAIGERETRYQIDDDDWYLRKVDEILHPAREDAQSLETTKENLGSYHFSAQYQQCPVPPGGNMIRREWFKTYRDCPDRSTFDLVVQSWDTASKAGELNDYSVCTTWGVIGADYYLLDIVRDRFEYPELKRRVVSEAYRYEADTVLIEDTGSGTSLIQDLRMERKVRPIGRRPRGDKITRMDAQTAKIEAGHVLIPDRASWLADFETEILAFPNGRHDDQVDSMSQFLNWIAVRQYRQRRRQRPPGRPRRRARAQCGTSGGSAPSVGYSIRPGGRLVVF